MGQLLLRTFLFLLLLVISAVSAGAVKLTVGSSDAQFQSIPEAISAAHHGDTIEVHAGTYSGNLVLNKQVTLLGINRPVIRGDGAGSVLTVLADGCVIKGLIVEHSGSNLQDEDSGILLKSDNNQIQENVLRDILYGIYLYRSRTNILRGNVIRGRTELELGERGAGIHLWDSPGNTIEDNIISETRDGMYIQSCNDNQIRRNRVFNLRYGLHYMFSDRNIFEDNLFADNVAGAAIMYSNHIEFRRNAFIHNRGFSSFGILFQDCDELLAEENFIVDNATGIFMEALRLTTFRHNVIANNDVGIQMFSSSDRNVFSENNFVDNLNPLQLVGKTSTTQWSQNGRGNFWSNYDGYDMNEDGIGDVPHRVQNLFEYMEGEHPRLRVYLESPAAKAMAMAEKTFPLFKSSSERDPAPLMKAIKLRYSFEQHGPASRADFGSMAISLLMGCMAAAVLHRSRRRRQTAGGRRQEQTAGADGRRQESSGGLGR